MDTGIWVDKDTGTPAVLEATMQPKGWDQWISTTAADAKYRYAHVIGSKITIEFMGDLSSNTGNARFLAGFGKPYMVSPFGVSEEDKYASIASEDVGEFINSDIVKGLRILTASQPGLKRSQKFTSHYSHKKMNRKLHRMGATAGSSGTSSSWFATYSAAPTLLPFVNFYIADYGLSTAATWLANIVTIEYTIRFSGFDLPQDSNL